MSALRNTPRVLVVEDEPDLCGAIVSFLNLSGFIADGVQSLFEFTAWIRTHDCDLVVLDRKLQDGEGLSIAKDIRAGGRRGLVILTGRGTIDDRLQGYAHGADHYLIKPVDLPELAAILNSIYLRLPANPQRWELDTVHWRLMAPNNAAINLTRSELIVLQCLAISPGESVARQEIIQALGFRPSEYDPKRMEVLMRRLRKKIESTTQHAPPIETVHAFGYAFTADLRVLGSYPC